MKAAVCREFGGPLVVEEVELDGPGRGEVRVRVAACAICHSDILAAEGAWGGSLPVLLGHEAAGVVEAVGTGVERVAPGDHVVVTLIRSCGTCFFCARGEPQLCEAELPARHAAGRSGRGTGRRSGRASGPAPSPSRSWSTPPRSSRSRATCRSTARRCWPAGSSPAWVRSRTRPTSRRAATSSRSARAASGSTASRARPCARPGRTSRSTSPTTSWPPPRRSAPRTRSTRRRLTRARSFGS